MLNAISLGRCFATQHYIGFSVNKLITKLLEGVMNWKRLFLIGCAFLMADIANAQKDWDLRLDKEGIKVYTKKLDSSPFKAVKTVCTINTSLSVLTAVLLDIKSTPDWVYATKKISLLKADLCC